MIYIYIIIQWIWFRDVQTKSASTLLRGNAEFCAKTACTQHWHEHIWKTFTVHCILSCLITISEIKWQLTPSCSLPSAALCGSRVSLKHLPPGLSHRHLWRHCSSNLGKGLWWTGRSKDEKAVGSSWELIACHLWFAETQTPTDSRADEGFNMF